EWVYWSVPNLAAPVVGGLIGRLDQLARDLEAAQGALVEQSVAEERRTAKRFIAAHVQCSDFDRVPVDVRYVGVRNTWGMLAAVEETAAGLLDEFDRSVDSCRRPVLKMNAEVLAAARTADAGTLVSGHG